MALGDLDTLATSSVTSLDDDQFIRDYVSRRQPDDAFMDEYLKGFPSVAPQAAPEPQPQPAKKSFWAHAMEPAADEVRSQQAEAEAVSFPWPSAISESIKRGGLGTNIMRAAGDFALNANFRELGDYGQRVASVDTGPVRATNKPTSWILQAANMIPYMWEAEKPELIAGGIGAAGGAAAGAIGGATAAPAAYAGWKYGRLAGTAASSANMYRLAVGELALDYMKQGETPENAAQYAILGAIPYAAIEYLNLDELVPVAGEAIATAAKRGVMRMLKHGGMQMVKNALAESGEEGLQEIVKQLADDVFKLIEKDERIPKGAITDAMKKGFDTFIQSIPPMFITQAPRGVFEMGRAAPTAVQADKVARTVENMGGITKINKDIDELARSYEGEQQKDVRISAFRADQEAASIITPKRNTDKVLISRLFSPPSADDPMAGSWKIVDDVGEIQDPVIKAGAKYSRVVGGELTGVPVIFYDTGSDTNAGMDGFVTDNAIYLNVKNPTASLKYVMEHEASHVVQRWTNRPGNEAHRQTLTDAARFILASEYGSNIRSRFNAKGISVKSQQINTEVEAMALATILTDQDAAKSLLNENPTLFKRVYDMVAVFFKQLADFTNRVVTGKPMDFTITARQARENRTTEHLLHFDAAQLRNALGPDATKHLDNLTAIWKDYIKGRQIEPGTTPSIVVTTQTMKARTEERKEEALRMGVTERRVKGEDEFLLFGDGKWRFRKVGESGKGAAIDAVPNDAKVEPFPTFDSGPGVEGPKPGDRFAETTGAPMAETAIAPLTQRAGSIKTMIEESSTDTRAAMVNNLLRRLESEHGYRSGQSNLSFWMYGPGSSKIADSDKDAVSAALSHLDDIKSADVSRTRQHVHDVESPLARHLMYPGLASNLKPTDFEDKYIDNPLADTALRLANSNETARTGEEANRVTEKVRAINARYAELAKEGILPPTELNAQGGVAEERQAYSETLAKNIELVHKVLVEGKRPENPREQAKIEQFSQRNFIFPKRLNDLYAYQKRKADEGREPTIVDKYGRKALYLRGGDTVKPLEGGQSLNMRTIATRSTAPRKGEIKPPSVNPRDLRLEDIHEVWSNGKIVGYVGWNSTSKKKDKWTRLDARKWKPYEPTKVISDTSQSMLYAAEHAERTRERIAADFEGRGIKDFTAEERASGQDAAMRARKYDEAEMEARSMIAKYLTTQASYDWNDQDGIRRGNHLDRVIKTEQVLTPYEMENKRNETIAWLESDEGRQDRLFRKNIKLNLNAKMRGAYLDAFKEQQDIIAEEAKPLTAEELRRNREQEYAEPATPEAEPEQAIEPNRPSTEAPLPKPTPITETGRKMGVLIGEERVPVGTTRTQQGRQVTVKETRRQPKEHVEGSQEAVSPATAKLIRDMWFEIGEPDKFDGPAFALWQEELANIRERKIDEGADEKTVNSAAAFVDRNVELLTRNLGEKREAEEKPQSRGFAETAVQSIGFQFPEHEKAMREQLARLGYESRSELEAAIPDDVVTHLDRILKDGINLDNHMVARILGDRIVREGFSQEVEGNTAGAGRMADLFENLSKQIEKFDHQVSLALSTPKRQRDAAGAAIEGTFTDFSRFSLWREVARGNLIKVIDAAAKTAAKKSGKSLSDIWNTAMAKRITKTVQDQVRDDALKRLGDYYTSIYGTRPGKGKNTFAQDKAAEAYRIVTKDYGYDPHGTTGKGGAVQLPSGAPMVSTPDWNADFERALSPFMASGYEKFIEAWKAGLLSGLSTMIQNPLSNFIRYTYEQGPKRAITMTLRGDAKNIHKVYRNWARLSSSMGARAVQYANWSYKHELPYFRFGAYGQKNDPNIRGRVKIAGKKGEYIRLPFRVLTWADEYFKAMSIQQYLIESYIKDNPNATSKDINKYLEEALRSGPSDTDPNIGIALERSLHHTWQNANPIAGPVAAARSAIPGGELVAPFLLTPVNLLSQGLRMSPFGILNIFRQVGQDQIRRSYNPELQPYVRSRKFAEDVAEQVVAWGLTAMLYGMIVDDDEDDEWLPRITGAKPYYKIQHGKGAFERTEAMPPRHIRIGNKMFDYSRLEPLNTMLPAIVDHIIAFRNAKKGEDAGKELASAIARVGISAADNTWLGSISDLAQAIGDPDMLASYVSNLTASFTPNIVKQAARATDPYAREMRLKGEKYSREWMIDWVQKTGYRMLPLERKDSGPMPQTDYWGNPVTKTNGETGILLKLLQMAGVNVKEVKDNKYSRMVYNWNNRSRFAVDEAAKKRYGAATILPVKYFDKPDASITLGRTRLGNEIKVYLSDEEYNRYVTEIGKLTVKRLDTMKFNIDHPTERDMQRLMLVRSSATRIVTQRWRNELLRKRRRQNE
jgi:hypothetical protein